MKILQLLAQKCDYTGSGLFLRALLNQARKLGHEVAAVAGLGPDDQPDIPNLFPVRFESEQLLERYRARKKPLGVIMLEVNVEWTV